MHVRAGRRFAGATQVGLILPQTLPQECSGRLTAGGPMASSSISNPFSHRRTAFLLVFTSPAAVPAQMRTCKCANGNGNPQGGSRAGDTRGSVAVPVTPDTSRPVWSQESEDCVVTVCARSCGSWLDATGATLDAVPLVESLSSHVTLRRHPAEIVGAPCVLGTRSGIPTRAGRRQSSHSCWRMTGREARLTRHDQEVGRSILMRCRSFEKGSHCRVPSPSERASHA